MNNRMMFRSLFIKKTQQKKNPHWDAQLWGNDQRCGVVAPHRFASKNIPLKPGLIPYVFR